MTFVFSVPTPSGALNLQVEPGTALLFVGANGGGKTRLAVKIEEELGNRAHRISAHRALNLNPSVPKIAERLALFGLRTGFASDDARVDHRRGSRWHGNAAVSLLNDYDHLLQALFAEQANTALKTHTNARAGNGQPVSATKFEKLVEIWDHILPHRALHITGDDIQVSVAGSTGKYAGIDLSDGERAIFYLIGQTLLAAPDNLIIFDEPELHIHRSIMSRLWDELEAVRPDCGMVFISHDLEFAASRKGQKYVLHNYNPTPEWTIEAVPDDTGFTEGIATLILGSRRPVLFVEGRRDSLDQAIYRACYPNWTVIDRGSCEEVIHAVVTMRANASLTRVTCAGIVDADAYDAADAQLLQSKGVAILPVSEIENLFLLPSVVEAIAKAEGYEGDDLKVKLTTIFDELFAEAADPMIQLPIVMRYCRRRIDRTLKQIDLSAAADEAALAIDYTAKTDALDVAALAKMATDSIRQAITNKDAPELLKWYDNKGVLGIACKARNTTKAQFEQWIVRVLRNNSAPGVSEAIRKALPTVAPA